MPSVEVCLESSIGITVTGVTSGTYTDMQKTKSYLALSLFDTTTLDEQIIFQAANAKDKINAFLGRSVDFTPAELETTRFAGITDAAAQLTACLVQRNPQAAAMSITEDTLIDCAEALETLKNWAHNNGITLPSEKKERGSILTELSYFYNNPDEVI